MKSFSYSIKIISPSQATQWSKALTIAANLGRALNILLTEPSKKTKLQATPYNLVFICDILNVLIFYHNSI